MITLLSNQIVATWLLISAWVLPHSQATSWNSIAVAVAVSGVAFLAFASPGRPGIRYLLAVLGAWLLMAAMVLPHVALSTVVHDVVVALVIGALSFFPPARWLTHWREEHAAKPHPAG